MTDREFKYFNLRANELSEEISTLFPDWNEGEEVVAVFSPHDDDALLGAGYSILGALDWGAEVFVFIFCKGDAGYSSLKEKDQIVEVRRQESAEAYSRIGVDEDHVRRFNYGDFSVFPFIGKKLPGGRDGTFAKTLPALREIGATRLLLPNGYREHLDHAAVNQIGAFDGPQVGDPILVDWGEGSPVKSFLEYAVWGDFSPEDRLIFNRKKGLRGNKLILADSSVEELVRNGLYSFKSQEEIIEDLVQHRKARRYNGYYVEVYLDFDPRPGLDFQPYKDYLNELEGRSNDEF